MSVNRMGTHYVDRQETGIALQDSICVRCFVENSIYNCSWTLLILDEKTNLKLSETHMTRYLRFKPSILVITRYLRVQWLLPLQDSFCVGWFVENSILQLFVNSDTLRLTDVGYENGYPFWRSSGNGHYLARFDLRNDSLKIWFYNYSWRLELSG